MNNGKKGFEGNRRVPIREDFYRGSLAEPETVRLAGCICQSCGEVFFGNRVACENCQSENLRDTVLGTRGKLWSFTVIRHRPPVPYVGPDPFVPFGVGWVELPEGVRVLSPLTDCDIEKLKVGMDVELVIEPLYTNEEGSEVMIHRFRPANE